MGDVLQLQFYLGALGVEWGCLDYVDRGVLMWVFGFGVIGVCLRGWFIGRFCWRVILGWVRFRRVRGVGCIGIVGIGRGVRLVEGGVHFACVQVSGARAYLSLFSTRVLGS